MAFGQEGEDDLFVGIKGVGDQEDLFGETSFDGIEEFMDLLGEGFLVLGRKDDSFMDSGEEGDGLELVFVDFCQESEGLKGVAEDVRGLGIVGGLLVEFLDPGHSLSFLGDLQAVEEEDGSTVVADRLEEPEGEADPEVGEFGEVEGRGVEEVKKAVVGFLLEEGSPSQAGHTPEIGECGEAEECEDEPGEGSFPAASIFENVNAFEPFEPELHRASFRLVGFEKGIICGAALALYIFYGF